MEQNPLTVSTSTPFPCDEVLNIPPGAPCMTHNTIQVLKGIIRDSDIDIEKLSPVIDSELVPSDGSIDSIIVRKLCRLLDIDSEYALLKHKTVINKLGEDTVKEEKNRFKTPGPRDINIGTHGDLHALRVLKKWRKLFTFFEPLKHAIYSKDLNKNHLENFYIIEAIKDNPQMKVLAAQITIATVDDITGWHAVVVLIDMRGDKDEPWSVEYFDSGGCPPVIHLTELLEDWTNKMKKYRKSIGDTGTVTSEIVSNKLKHQL